MMSMASESGASDILRSSKTLDYTLKHLSNAIDAGQGVAGMGILALGKALQNPLIIVDKSGCRLMKHRVIIATVDCDGAGVRRRFDQSL
jgi:hypothetical protein